MGSMPPEFNPPRQQSGNKVWLWLLLAVGMLCILCGIGGYFAFRSAMNLGGGVVGCGITGDLARNAVLAYALEHDGKFPTAENWQDEIRPNYELLYNKMVAEQGYQDMSKMMKIRVAAPGTQLECDFGGGTISGFSYNAEIAGKPRAELPDSTVVIFETTSPKYNQSGLISERPSQTPKLMGDSRPWMDFMIAGQSELGESPNAGMDFDTKPEDGLTKEPAGTTSGGANPTGA